MAQQGAGGGASTATVKRIQLESMANQLGPVAPQSGGHASTGNGESALSQNEGIREGRPTTQAQALPAPQAFKPPSRLELRKTSIHDFVPGSPNSARAKRSPKSSSYATRYESRINSPGSLMSPHSEAAALLGASARDESTEEAQWRMRVEPRVVRRSLHRRCRRRRRRRRRRCRSRRSRLCCSLSASAELVAALLGGCR